MSRQVVQLEYQKLLNILAVLPDEDARYVMYFLSSSDQKARLKARELEGERVALETVRMRAEKNCPDVENLRKALKETGEILNKEREVSVEAKALNANLSGQLAGVARKIKNFVSGNVPHKLQTETEAELQALAEDCCRLIARKEAEVKSVRVRQLEVTLAMAALPLETLFATEMDGVALCEGVKRDIREAVMEIRGSLNSGE